METKAFEDFDSMDTQQEEQAKKEKKASAAKVAGIAGAAGIAGGATAFGVEAAIDMINNNIDIEDEIIEEAPTPASPSAHSAHQKPSYRKKPYSRKSPQKFRKRSLPPI